MTIGLILCIVFVTGCSKGISLTNTIKALKFEEIKSARIEFGRAGASPIKSYTFDFNNSDHTKVLKDVIDYLNSAIIMITLQSIVLCLFFIDKLSSYSVNLVRRISS